MTTTGQLRAIVEELELVDVGDAASYIGEEAIEPEEASVSALTMFAFTDRIKSVITDDLFCYQVR